MAKIKSIEKGWGEGSTYFSTDPNSLAFVKVDEIMEEKKDIGPGFYTVYRGYTQGNLVFEIEAGSNITLTFYQS